MFRKHFKNYFSSNDILNEVGDIQKLIKTQLLNYAKFKISFLAQVEYILQGENNIILEREIFNVRSSNFVISRNLAKKKFEKTVKDHLFEIMSKEKDMTLPQSGWISNKIILVDVNLPKLNFFF